jgi:opacity protein-like surface antigen
MMKTLRSFLPLLVPLLVLWALPATAQDWSIGGATGAFIFGDFYERRLRIGTGTEAAEIVTTLSAATRAGLSVDLERRLSRRFAIRFEGTFTEAPIALKGDDDNFVEIDAGEVRVTTFMIPLVVNINTGGAFRFHVLAGPAYAIYDIERRSAPTTAFDGTRSKFGGAAGAGLAWWLSERFALEGQILDIVTSSPFDRSDFPATVTGLDIPNTQNVHTTLGIRLRF